MSPKRGTRCAFCVQRRRVYPILLLLCLLVLFLVLYNIKFVNYMVASTTTQPPPARFSSPNSEPDAIDACLVPGTYTPKGPGTCILTADGTTKVVPGVPNPTQLPWKNNECEETIARVAPWLQPIQRNRTQEMQLVCRVDAKMYNSTPLFIVEKHKNAYSITEPLWASPKVGHNELVDRTSTPGRCPDQYLTSHTHGYGQTFNQLQNIVSAIWLSRVFNRTYVLPLLSARKDPTPVNVADIMGNNRTAFERYFNVDKLRAAGYCIVNYSSFEADIRRRYKSEKDRKMVYYENITQRYYTKLFHHGKADVAPLLAPPTGVAVAPLTFSVSFKRLYKVLSTSHTKPMQVPSAPLIMLDNKVAFFVRAPFKEAIHIFGLLEPSPAIAAKLKEELKLHTGRHTVALHLRYRERFCEREQSQFHRYLWPPTTSSTEKLQRSDGGRKSIVEECAYTAVQSMQTLHFAIDHLLPYSSSPSFSSSFNKSKAERINPSSVSLLLATDRQRKKEIQALRNTLKKEGFSLYTSAQELHVKGYTSTIENKVFAVVLDYFLLVHAEVFFGNRMSSISQSACLARLGQGKGCHGVPAGFFRALFYPDGEHLIYR